MNAPLIMAIETSGRQGSVALARGPVVLAESGFSTDREHARELLPTLDKLCREQGWRPSEIEQCYVSIGPGSFTGLRVAVTFARHLALAGGARIVAVPTLEVIAENCAILEPPPAHVAVILDAKRGQVFAAVYERAAPTASPESGAIADQQMGDIALPTGLDRHPISALRPPAYRCLVEPCLIEPVRLLAGAPRPLAMTGEGIDYHRAALDVAEVEVLDRTLWPPQARNVHRVGWQLALAECFTPSRELVPFYLRRPEAEELWEKRHGAPRGHT